MKKWTEKEHEILRTHYPGKKIEEIRENFLPHRSLSMIHHKVWRLQLGRKKISAIYKTLLEKKYKLSSEEIAYISGIIDGEGSISVLKVLKKKPIRHILTPKIVIVNTDKKLMDWLAQKLETPIFLMKRYVKKWKQCFKIEISGYKVLPLLRIIQPYLVSKKERAELVIKYVEERMKRRFKAQYSTKEIGIANRVKQLNKKGSIGSEESRQNPTMSTI